MAEDVALLEGAVDAEAAAEAVALAVAESVPVEDAVPVRRALALAAEELLAVALPELVAAALTVAALEREDVPVAVAEGVQEGSAAEPDAQAGVHTQGTQVALEDAPSAGEKVPAGHGVGFTEERGQ